MDARAKARRQQIAVIKARLNELERARNYIGYTDYYWTRFNSLTVELRETIKKAQDDDFADLSSPEKIEQYLVTFV
jgi:hypothetical protein